jgi:hypothetical protein
MLPYISKINNNKDYLTAGLLLEEIPAKEFDTIKASQIEKVKTVKLIFFDNKFF